MKNVIIAFLVIAVGALSFILFNQSKSIDDNSSSKSSSSQTSETKKDNPKTSGDSIDLSDKGLNEVSKDILEDKSVTSMDVSGNNLTGALPAEIRMLSNLEELDASNNNLTGIPAEIGQLSKLRLANFSNNDISGLPLEIGNLNNLETLDLRGNPNVSEYDISQIQSKIPNAKILTN